MGPGVSFKFLAGIACETDARDYGRFEA